MTHLESVLELPAGAELLAASPTDPHHAFRIGARAWGVQFHPEFDADVLRGYVAERAEDLRREHIAPEEVESGIVETPAGPALLRRFAEIVFGLPGGDRVRPADTSRGGGGGGWASRRSALRVAPRRLARAGGGRIALG